MHAAETLAHAQEALLSRGWRGKRRRVFGSFLAAFSFVMQHSKVVCEGVLKVLLITGYARLRGSTSISVSTNWAQTILKSSLLDLSSLHFLGGRFVQSPPTCRAFRNLRSCARSIVAGARYSRRTHCESPVTPEFMVCGGIVRVDSGVEQTGNVSAEVFSNIRTNPLLLAACLWKRTLRSYSSGPTARASTPGSETKSFTLSLRLNLPSERIRADDASMAPRDRGHKSGRMSGHTFSIRSLASQAHMQSNRSNEATDGVSNPCSIIFGKWGLPDFNKLIIGDDFLLYFFGIRQAVLEPVVHEDCSTAGSSNSCGFKYAITWKLRGREVRVYGEGRSKKDAKREAVKHLMVQLGPVGETEYEEVTRYIFSSLKGKLRARQQGSSRSSTEYVFQWQFNHDGSDVTVEAAGRGASAHDAEINAMQTMYLKASRITETTTNSVKGIEPAHRSENSASKQQPTRHKEHKTPQLSKQDAGDINALHNTVTARNQIKATEIIKGVSEGQSCALEWRWKSMDGCMRSHTVTGIGPSKAIARAQAALQMMSAGGFMEHVDAKQRQAARAVVDLVEDKKDAAICVQRACTLLAETNGAVWRLFLPSVWRCVLAEGEQSLVDAILAALKKATLGNRVDPAEPSTEPAVQDHSGQCATEEDSDAAMPPDLWEQLLDECTVLSNCEFGQKVLHELGELPLDKRWFPSPLARRYFQNYRLMLALEWQAQLATTISERRDYADMFEGKHLLLTCKSVVMPLLSLSTTLRQEDRDFLSGVQFREDDCVLLRPIDPTKFSDVESWRMCLVGVVTSVKGDFSVSLNVNVRLASAEVKKHPEVLSVRQYNLYYLAPAVTHDRMVQALRGLTMSRAPFGKSAPPYIFTPEIRHLILHTMESQASDVAARGSVPQLSDTDPEHYNPLHQLDELVEGSDTSKKKQRAQVSLAPRTSLAQHVAQQARRQLLSSSPSVENQMSAADFMEVDSMDISRIKLPTDLPLTEAQRQACLSALTCRLTLVQGPPGTGKTHVACAIIDAWRQCSPSKKILAVADSNVAADNLMEGLSRRGIRCVRVGNGSESDLQEESISDLSRYREYVRLKDSGMHGEARSIRMILFREAVLRHSVIIATCVGSGHEIFDDVVFERVIIDECAQSIEPSNLIPLGHGCRTFVLIGDHKQLPPTIVSCEAAQRGLDVSLLERFVGSGIAPIHLLDEQRRMHPSIAIFPNMQFYDGKLESRDVDDFNRPPVGGFSWPSQHSRVCLVDICGGGYTNMEQPHGTSKYSLIEIDPILAIVRSVLECGGVLPSQIGVLTPYDAQKVRLRHCMNDTFDSSICYQIEVDSVDGFQGKEKDLILFSAVRSNQRGEIGFLKDPRRMNVMLTRARRGVVVIGDQVTLWADEENWRPWISWVGSMRSIIPLARLNDHLEVATYPSQQEIAVRIGSHGYFSGGANQSASAGPIKQAFVPQGFKTDIEAFSSKESKKDQKGEGDRRVDHVADDMETDEVPEDWEQHL